MVVGEPEPKDLEGQTSHGSQNAETEPELKASRHAVTITDRDFMAELLKLYSKAAGRQLV